MGDGLFLKCFRGSTGNLMFNDIGMLSLISRLPDGLGPVAEIMLGKIAVSSNQPLYTIVGASVAVCLLDAKSGIVAMGHVILPSQFSHHREDAMLRSDSALEALYNEICDAIRSRNMIPQLKAKVFGGANLQREGASISDGEQSTIFAKNWLRTRSIPIVSESVGGGKRREIVLLPVNGKVFCKQVSMSSEFLARERDALMPASAPLNSVELF